MKKNSTLMLLLSVLVSNVLFGQYEYKSSPSVIKPANKVSKPSFKSHRGARAGSVSLTLDYGIVDSLLRATASPSAVYDNTLVGLNLRDPRPYNTRVAGVSYRRMFNLDSSTGIPLYEHLLSSTSSIKVDSLFFYYAHVHNNGLTKKDTITVKVKQIPLTGGITMDDTGYVAPLLWSETIITDTSLTGPGAQPNTYRIRGQFVRPNITVPAGFTFAVQVDFAGDTANEFFLLSDFMNTCGTCAARASMVPNTTLRLNGGTMGSSAGTQGYNGTSWGYTVSYNCGTGSGDTACELLYEQNLEIYPFITINFPNLTVGAASEQIPAANYKLCKNDQVQLNSFVSGASGAVTYSWTPTTGLDNPAIANPIATVGAASVVYTVKAKSGTDSSTATVTVFSRDITVTLPATTSITSCATGVTITPTVGGTTTGRTNLWSTGATTATLSGVKAAGTYSVTVSNSFGCRASASTVASNANTATLDFTVPSAVCIGKTNVLVNTSSDLGLTFSWSDNAGSINLNSNNKDADYAPTGNAGVRSVTLKGVDGNGCEATPKSKNVNVLASTATACKSAIHYNTIGAEVTVYPNPTADFVHVDVEGLNKDLTISLVDMLGNTVSSRNVKANAVVNEVFDISKESNGIYFIKLQSGDQTTVKKVTLSK